MFVAANRWIRAREKYNPAQPRAPRGTGIGGQWISGAAGRFIRGLLGADDGEGKADVRRSTGRFRGAGGSMVSVRLPSRRPRQDDRVRDRRTGRLGTVVALVAPEDTRYFRPGEATPRAGQQHPPSARIRWDDGRVETKPLSELDDPGGDRPLPDPGREFDADRGERRRMDDAVEEGRARPRTAAERLADGIASGQVVGRDRQDALDVVRRRAGMDAPMPRGPRSMSDLADMVDNGDLTPEQARRVLAGEPFESVVGAKPSRPAPKPERAKVDVRAIAAEAGVDVDLIGQDVVDDIQERIDNGESPAAAGRYLDQWANGAAGPFYRSAVIMGVNDHNPDDAARAEAEAEAARHRARGAEWVKLAERLQSTRRPAARSKPSPAEVGAAVQRGEITPGEAARLLGMEGVPGAAPDANDVLDDFQARWENPPSREEAHGALAHLSRPQLLVAAKRLSIPGARSKNADQLRAEIVEATVGRRLDSIAVRGFTGLRPRAPDGDSAPLISPHDGPENAIRQLPPVPDDIAPRRRRAPKATPTRSPVDAAAEGLDDLPPAFIGGAHTDFAAGKAPAEIADEFERYANGFDGPIIASHRNDQRIRSVDRGVFTDEYADEVEARNAEIRAESERLRAEGAAILEFARRLRDSDKPKPARKSTARKATPKAAPDIKAIRSSVAGASTREEVDALTDGLTVSQLRELQTEMGMVPVGRTKPEIRRHIAQMATAEQQAAGLGRDTPALRVPRAAGLPSGADIEVVGSTRDLTPTEIVQGRHLTPAGRDQVLLANDASGLARAGETQGNVKAWLMRSSDARVRGAGRAFGLDLSGLDRETAADRIAAHVVEHKPAHIDVGADPTQRLAEQISAMADADESSIVAALQGLTTPKLRKVADESGIKVPTTMKDPAEIRTFIARSLKAFGHGGGDIAVWQASDGETAVGRVVDLGPRRRFIDWEGGRREPLSHRSASNVTFHREGDDAPAPGAAARRMASGRAPRGVDTADVAVQVAGASSEADMIRILAGDTRLTSAQLGKVARELDIDVPEGMRAKTAIQLHIAEVVARRRALPSGTVDPLARVRPEGGGGARGPNPRLVREEMVGAGTAEQRRAALERLDMTQAQARRLAKDLSVPGMQRSSTDRVIDAIVGHFDTSPDTRHRGGSPADIGDRLQASTSREEAHAHLDGLTSAQLKEVADATGTYVGTAGTKDAMKAQIVEHTVGFRLNSQTIRHGSWDAGSPRAARASVADTARSIRRLSVEGDILAELDAVRADQLRDLAYELNITIPPTARSAAARKRYIAQTLAAHNRRTRGGI